MGRYVLNNLFRNERVIFETHYHWIIFFKLSGILTLFIYPLIQLYTDEFVITSQRIIIKTGLLAIHTREMNHNRVETANVYQPLLGRLLGYGNITIIGSGGTRETFRNIRSPLQFRRNIMNVHN